MESLLIQEELRRDGLDAVQQRYNLLVKRHATFPNLVLFKYHQILSPIGECRGLILDCEANFAVVSFPYRRFFNYGEQWAAQIDWQSARVFEKLDGSLATLYWYRGVWHVASSGTPDAVSPLESCKVLFRELFWRIWGERKLSLPAEDDAAYCFMFEMLSLDHIIVNRPERNELVLHGVRNVRTLQELDPTIYSEKYGWPLAPSHGITSLEDAVSTARHLNPAQHEGFVVRDGNYNRIKVKTPQYVALSLMNVYDSKNFNYKHMTKILITHEDSEFLTYFPVYEDLYRIVKGAYANLLSSMKATLPQLEARSFGESVSEKEVRALVTTLLKGVNPKSVRRYVDICMKYLTSEGPKTIEEVLEKWPEGELVLLMQQFHGPEERQRFAEYRKNLPKKPKGQSGKQVATSSAVNVGLEGGSESNQESDI